MRKLQTKLLRENGQTAVIGGIYTTEYTKARNGIPFFSNLPLIGALFRNTTWRESKRELIVMVTPSVINSAKSLSATGEIGNGTLANNFGEANALTEEGFNNLNQGGFGNNNFNNFGDNDQDSGGNNESDDLGNDDFSQDNFGQQGNSQQGNSQQQNQSQNDSDDSAGDEDDSDDFEQEQEQGQEE